MHYYKLSVVIIGLAIIASLVFLVNFNETTKNDELVVVTRNAPTTYYEARDGFAGVEYDLVERFAASLGLKTKYIVKDSVDDILAALQKNEGDIAAAGLTHTHQRRNGFLFSSDYQKVQQQVVCRRGGLHPKNAADLIKVKLAVPARSSYAEQLKKIKSKYPSLNWLEDTDNDTEELLAAVWQRKFDCTIADSNIVAINRRYYPELVVRFNLTQPESLAWVLNKNSKQLQKKINHWLAKEKSSGQLSQTLNKYYGFIEVFDYVENRAFQRGISKKLPKYKSMFVKAADHHGLAWTLLAAQSYQESHWKPNAKSPTGVRGMMMLTRTTAKELKIKNRLDPVQSVQGGAKYLSLLIKRIPKDVKQPDRTWYALAAYNIGMGHLYDARKLARHLGKNPSLWSDMSEVFPLLSQKKYYRTLKHGYARGREPVRYVKRIRDYQDILDRMTNH